MSAPILDDDDRRIERFLRTNPAALAAANAGVGRRRFLQGALALGAASSLDLRFLTAEAGAAPLAPDQNILVLIELTGGNDGLNLLAPTGDGRYHDRRRGLAIQPGAGHRIDDGWELHPAMPGLAARHRAGSVAFIESVGEVTGDHSHFVTMARVMAGTPTPGPTPTGWAGRFLDDAAANVLAGVNVDNGGVPLHMIGRRRQVTGLTTHERLFGSTNDDAWQQPLHEAVLARGGDAGISVMDRTRAVFADGVRAARQIEPVYEVGETPDDITRKMLLLANTINLDVGAQILSTRHSGFDLHADLAGPHARLLGELDGALEAFFGALDARFADRVAVLVFSEFGRRVAANDSAGVDHGFGNTWFVVGNRVRGGRYGQPADLGTLTRRGDLLAHVDTRSVYASAIAGWLGGDDAAVLGAEFEKLDLFLDAGEPAPGGGGTTPPADDPDARYIDALHRLFLGRAAAASEIAEWRPHARSDRSTITRALAVSDEWAGVRVDDLYRTILGRGADRAGRRAWVAEIAAGMRLEDVAARFYGSTEYFNRVGATNLDFVTSLYERILGRSPDRAGRDAWVHALEHGGSSRRRVAAGFYASIESRRQRVTTLYTEILGRRPDAGGLETWARYLRTSGDVTLASKLAASAEYYQRAQR